VRGSRNILSEAVICALLRDFSKHGAQAQGAKVVDGKLVDAAALPAPDTRAG
jgi:hypothetical protein